LTKADLPNAFNTGNFSAASQQAVIDQLIADKIYSQGVGNGKIATVESDIYKGVPQPPQFDSNGNPVVPPPVQVLEVEGQNVTVQTNSTLQVIVDDGSGPNNILNVTGGNNPVYIALGNSNTTVNLNDSGNDTVLGGAGNDSITAHF